MSADALPRRVRVFLVIESEALDYGYAPEEPDGHLEFMMNESSSCQSNLIRDVLRLYAGQWHPGPEQGAPLPCACGHVHGVVAKEGDTVEAFAKRAGGGT